MGYGKQGEAGYSRKCRKHFAFRSLSSKLETLIVLGAQLPRFPNEEIGMFVVLRMLGGAGWPKYLKKKYGGAKISQISAGTLAGKHVHPEVSTVMKENG